LSNQKKYGIILLAAGSSSRLGQPKQQLPFQKTSLLEHMIHIALGAKVSEVIAVVNEVFKHISPAEKMTLLINEDAASGLSSSIRKGIETIKEKLPEAEAVIIMPCDQPFLTTAILDKLISKFESTDKGIIAARYAETFGTPALFHHRYFDQLLQLQGDVGAKSIMKAHTSDMAYVDFPQGGIDIDTPDDLKNMGIIQ